MLLLSACGDAVQVSLRLQANPDNALYVKDKSMLVDVMANDRGVVSGVSARIVRAAQKGVAMVNADGRVEYLPAEGNCGEDVFVYALDDGIGGYSEASVTMEGVGCVLFEAQADHFSFSQGSSLTFDVRSNDIGRVDLAKIFVVVSPVHGSVQVDNVQGVVKYTSSTQYCGEDRFLYALVGQGSYSEAEVTLVAEVASCSQSYIAVADNVNFTQDVSVTFNVLSNDVGATGAESIVLMGAPLHGRVVLQEAGNIVYQPDAGYCGVDQFTYAVWVGGEYSAAKISLRAVGCLATLQAIDDNVAFSFGQPLTFNVLSNDIGRIGDEQLALLTSPAGGAASVFSDGTVLYVPRDGFCSADTFRYVLTGGGRTAQANVALTPQNCRLAMSSSPDLIEYNQGQAVMFNVLQNDAGYFTTDKLYLLSTPANGSVRAVSFGVFEYKPFGSYCGIDSFSYVVDAGYGNTATGQVTLSTTDCGHSFNLSWDASISPNVAGYRVYMGRTSGNYTKSIDVGNVLNYKYVVTSPGTYYFAVTAVSQQGIESDFSQEQIAVY